MTIKRRVKLQQTQKGYYLATIPKSVIEEYGYSPNDILELRATKKGIRLMKGDDR